MEKLNQKAAEDFVLKQVATGSQIMTDKLKRYTVVEKAGYELERIIVSENPEQALKTFKLVHTVISNAKTFV